MPSIGMVFEVEYINVAGEKEKERKKKKKVVITEAEITEETIREGIISSKSDGLHREQDNHAFSVLGHFFRTTFRQSFPVHVVI